MEYTPVNKKVFNKTPNFVKADLLDKVKDLKEDDFIVDRSDYTKYDFPRGTRNAPSTPEETEEWKKVLLLTPAWITAWYKQAMVNAVELSDEPVYEEMFGPCKVLTGFGGKQRKSNLRSRSGHNALSWRGIRSFCSPAALAARALDIERGKYDSLSIEHKLFDDGSHLHQHPTETCCMVHATCEPVDVNNRRKGCKGWLQQMDGSFIRLCRCPGLACVGLSLEVDQIQIDGEDKYSPVKNDDWSTTAVGNVPTPFDSLHTQEEPDGKP